MKAAIYCRVSTPGQEENGTSLETQEAACRTYCATLGYEVSEVYKEARSGSLLWERRELQRMLDGMRVQQFGVIVSYSLDRLSRPEKVEDFFYLTTEARRYKCGIEFVSETYDDSPTGKLLQSVFAFLAGEERRKIAERTRRGRDAKLREGKLVTGGSPMYGYRKNKEEQRREIYEPEAAVVRHIYELYVFEKLSLWQVAKQLDQEGVPRPRGGRTFQTWQRNSIRELLKNPAYRGETIAIRLGKSSVPLPEERWIRLPEGVTPRIVSDDLWYAAQERLASNKGTQTRNAVRPFLLRGHIFCGICGMLMAYGTNNSTKTRVKVNQYWRCQSAQRGDHACGNSMLPIRREPEAWDQLVQQLRQSDFLEQQLALLGSEDIMTDVNAELEKAEQELKSIGQQEERLLDLYLSPLPGFSRETLSAKTQSLAEQKAGIEQRITELTLKAATLKRSHAALLEFSDVCKAVIAKLDDPDFATKREIIEALNVRATWTKGTLKVEIDPFLGVNMTSTRINISPHPNMRAAHAPMNSSGGWLRLGMRST